MNALVKLIWILVLWVPLSLPAAATPAFEDDKAYFSRAELDQMLAPIALYPDTVLSHVLIASTYPLEVVEAARWSHRHPHLQGEEAVEAVKDMDWDPSVKALVAFPEILARMDEDLEWIQRLGEAFLAQEAQVMDSVQGLRERAYAVGSLNSLEHVRVIRERESILIEPAFSRIVYLPYYDPSAIYGSWWWPAHRPYRWRHWLGHPVAHYRPGFHWGSGFGVSPVFYSSAFNWHQRQVVVVHHHHAGPIRSGLEVARHGDARHWRHHRTHRRGVAYRNKRLNRDYGPNRRDALDRAQDLARRESAAKRSGNERHKDNAGRDERERVRNQLHKRRGDQDRDAYRSRNRGDSRFETRSSRRSDNPRPKFRGRDDGSVGGDGNRPRGPRSLARPERPARQPHRGDRAAARAEERRPKDPRGDIRREQSERRAARRGPDSNASGRGVAGGRHPSQKARKPRHSSHGPDNSERAVRGRPERHDGRGRGKRDRDA